MVLKIKMGKDSRIKMASSSILPMMVTATKSLIRVKPYLTILIRFNHSGTIIKLKEMSIVMS